MTEIELRNKVAACARSWLGRKEANGSHREIIDVYNRITPLPGNYRMSYTDPWCAAFVSAVGARCGLTDIILPECSCERMIARYRKAGRWQEADSYPARIGDLVMYDWQDSGVGDNTGEADHVGIIVDAAGDVLTVIEGNKSDAVGCRTLRRNGRYIRGFCCPDYASRAEAAPTEDKPAEEDAGAAAVLIDHSTQAEPETVTPAAGAVWLPTLREGDKSAAVVNAQRILIGRGYDCGGPRRRGQEFPDGEYGPRTANSVIAFQDLRGLEPTGIIGPETWAKLITT